MKLSKFSPKSEPFNPFGAMRRRMAENGIRKVNVTSSVFSETYKVNNKILSEIKTLYEKELKSNDPKSLYTTVGNIQKGIQKMEEVAKQAGINMDGKEKNGIIDDINRAKSMLETLRLKKI